MPIFRSRVRHLAMFVAMATLAPALAASAGDAPRTTRPAESQPAPVTCAGSIRMPIAVRVSALDPVVRGQRLRLRVEVGAERAFERAEVRLSSSGGAAVSGTRSVSLRAVPAGGRAEAEFAVTVPAGGERTLVQFQVDASGEFGAVRRGATYNLLPDGPVEHPRIARTASGENVAEVTARRIAR